MSQSAERAKRLAGQGGICRVPDCGRRDEIGKATVVQRAADPDDSNGRGDILGLYAMLSAVFVLFVLGQTLEWPPIQTDQVQVTRVSSRM